MPTVLVTGAGGPLGVNLTRSLRRASEPLRVVGTDANRWHLPLSLCDRTYRVPLARDADGYAAALCEIAERERVDAIVPTHPVEVRAVAALRDEGRLAGMGTALPRTAVLETADDKVATQRALRAAGVPVPATISLAAPADLRDAFARFAPPVWVRGAGAPGLGIGGAALPCRDEGVARAWIDHHRGWGRMAASEFLPGANLTWMAAFDRGTLLAAAQRERLEYVLPHVSPSGITGAPAVSRTIARDDVTAIGMAAVAALDDQPHGVYFVDLKESAEGEPRVTEINAGRCGTTIHFYTEAGCNFPWLLTAMALGREVKPLAKPHEAVEPELYWVRTLDCGPELVRGEAGFDGYPVAGPRVEVAAR
jgi:carbamoyl-phosphate synthase large subunit